MVRIRRVRRQAACPRCGRLSPRHSVQRRQLRDLGLTGPAVTELALSYHRCSDCEKFFMLPADDVAEPGSSFTNRVKEKVLQSVYQDGLPVDAVVGRMRRDFHVRVPRSTLYYWLSLAGGKGRTR